MKIAWLAPYPVSNLGDALKWGIDRASIHSCSWIVNLSKALAEDRSVELHLLTLSPWVARSQTVERDGFFIHVIKSGIPFIHRGWPGFFPFDALTGFIFESSKLCYELNRIHPDVVHTHGTEREYALTAMRSGYPYLISIQGILAEFNKTNPTIHNRILEPWERRVVRESKYFTCRTHFDTGFVHRLNPVAKIFDIPEAMNPVFWKGPWDNPGGRRILFVGGGEPRKGLHELIEAMALVVKDIPDASIDVVGFCSPERQKVLEETARRIGVTVRFHGFKNATELAALHRQCSLFVLCSSNENSPNTLAEAMVSGMPCLAYNVGGVSSMVEDGQTGLLVAPHDVAGLAAGVVELLVDKNKAQMLGRNAAEVARIRHEPRHVAEETMKAYRLILANVGQTF